MSNPWAGVDSLMRELGAVRAQVNTMRGLEDLDAGVSRRIEAAIEAAATAVDDTIATPSNAAVVRQAWDAIERAQATLGELREASERAGRIISDSRELRRRSERLIGRTGGSTSKVGEGH